MLATVSVIFIILGLIKKDSKVLFYLIFVLLIILFAGSTGNADQLAYMNNYTNILYGMSDSSFEYGYQLLCKVCLILGMSYNQFLFIIAFTGLTLIASTIKLYTSNIAYVLALYFIYPFVWDTIQIRNFLAMSIIIYGSRFIISYKKEYIKYFICVIIASLMHVTALFYISALLVVFKNTKKMLNIVSITACASILLMPKILGYTTIFTSTQKINAYTTTQTSLITKVCVIIYFAFSIILVKISRDIMNNINREGKISKNDNLKSYSKKIKNGILPLKYNQSKSIEIDSESILKINIVAILSLYFLINNLDFFRLYRNIFVINYILFALTLENMKKNYIYYVFYLCVLILGGVSLGLLTIYVPSTNLIDPLFKNNIISEWIVLFLK